MNEDLCLSSYDYPLPQELIAQHPKAKRPESRLMVLERESGQIQHLKFKDILDFLRPGDCMIINKTKVFKARLLGRKPTGGKIEFLLLHYPKEVSPGRFRAKALVKSSKRPKKNLIVSFQQLLEAKILGWNQEGHAEIELRTDAELDQVLEKIGSVPLPPYIKRPDDQQDKTRYQTVYATDIGSVAAPTAGLHFSSNLINEIYQKGIEIAPVVLHVGYGTFSPIRYDDITKHKIHEEWIKIPEESAKKINRAKSDGKRILCVGTTSVRTVEFVASRLGKLCPFSGTCDLFIYPGFKFKVTDMMLTNFHLPKSSLLLLVSAFAGREKILNAYRKAIEEKYRFFSYGDAMLII